MRIRKADGRWTAEHRGHRGEGADFISALVDLLTKLGRIAR